MSPVITLFASNDEALKLAAETAALLVDLTTFTPFFQGEKSFLHPLVHFDYSCFEGLDLKTFVVKVGEVQVLPGHPEDNNQFCVEPFSNISCPETIKVGAIRFLTCFEKVRRWASDRGIPVVILWCGERLSFSPLHRAAVLNSDRVIIVQEDLERFQSTDLFNENWHNVADTVNAARAEKKELRDLPQKNPLTSAKLAVPPVVTVTIRNLSIAIHIINNLTGDGNQANQTGPAQAGVEVPPPSPKKQRTE